MTHETILKMIEAVSPDDVALLDEIDARVWCLVKVHRFTDVCHVEHEFEYSSLMVCEPRWRSMAADHPAYTRSRDALKAIRPEGWNFEMRCGSDGFFATALSNDMIIPSREIFRTEELAELHAIIQAMAWERDNKEAEK